MVVAKPVTWRPPGALQQQQRQPSSLSAFFFFVNIRFSLGEKRRSESASRASDSPHTLFLHYPLLWFVLLWLAFSLLTVRQTDSILSYANLADGMNRNMSVLVYNWSKDQPSTENISVSHAWSTVCDSHEAAATLPTELTDFRLFVSKVCKDWRNCSAPI